MKESGPENDYPFISPLVESEHNYKADRSRLKEFLNNPDFVVRVEHLFGGIQNKIDEVLQLKKMFDELRSQYGINVPVDFVIGNLNGSDSLYTIVSSIKEVEDEEIRKKSTENEQYKAEARNVFGNLIQYYVDKYNKHEEFLWDIAKLEQFVYGKKKGDDQNHLYFVDVEGLTENPSRKGGLRMLLTELGYIKICVRDIKKRYDIDLQDLLKKAEEVSRKIDNGKNV